MTILSYTAAASRRVRVAPSRPRLAVIVSTFERPGHLRLCLESIAAQHDVAHLIEVIVTDDGSRDGTLAMVADFSARAAFRVACTSHPHDGFRLARCRNEGAAVASADMLLFTDGDCLLPPGTLASFLDAIRPRRIAGGDCWRLDEQATRKLDRDAVRSLGYLPAVDPGERRRVARKGRRARIYQVLRLPMRPRLCGNAIGITLADFDSLNGFDEEFVGWGLEDRDLQHRAERLGMRVVSMHHMPFVHQWHPIAPSFIRNAVGTPNERHHRRRGKVPQCGNGFRERAVATMVTLDSRPPLITLPVTGRRRVA
jgi:glycosyltransferase involved in cell wall biosynthesis